MKNKILLPFIALIMAFGLVGCGDDDADIVSENLSKAADNFEVERRIVFLNVESGKYELEIQGLCSIGDDGNQLEVICKTGPDEFKKHFLGKAQDFTYFAEQTESVEADPYHYRVTFKPEVIIPDVDLRTDGK